jgi:hypothetical protein
VVACAFEGFESVDDGLSKAVDVKTFVDPANVALLRSNKMALGALEPQVGQEIGQLDSGQAVGVRCSMETESDVCLTPLEPH